jgi:hypothetical protein
VYVHLRQGAPSRVHNKTDYEQAGGQLGSHIAKALLETRKHSVTALVREDSTSKVPEGVKVSRVTYDDEESLVSALRGQQCLVITLSVRAAPSTQEKIIKAAAKAGVSWVFPNSWGTDFTNESLATESMTGPGVWSGINAVEAAGVSSWVGFVCGKWYEYSLAMGPFWFGFDIRNKRVELYDDGNTKINVTTWAQCGRAMASLLSLKELPEDQNDTVPTLSHWRNSPVYISSFLVSQRDILGSINRVLGTEDSSWEIEYEPSNVRYQRGLEMMKAGESLGFGMSLTVRSFYAENGGNHESRHELANEVLSLPQEEIDDATKRGLALYEEKYRLLGDYGASRRICAGSAGV